MSMAIDGLVSGMNTTDLVNQLMQAEALPQTAIKNKITTQNKVVTAYQAVNTKMTALLTAAKALGDPDIWGAKKATSSSDAVVVTAGAGASAGSLSFRVESLATTHTLTFTNDRVASATTKKTEWGDKSLNEIVAGINADSTSLYKASAVQVGAGEYALQLTAKTSGTAPVLDPSKLPAGVSLSNATTTVQGTNAVIRIGEDIPGADPVNDPPISSSYTVTSATNTFTDVLPGVTITAAQKTAANAPVTVNVVDDTDAVATKVQALVDTLNAALTEISTQSKAKSGATAAGALTGDSTMRALRQDLLGAVSRGVAGVDGGAGISSVEDIGVVLGRDGTISFKKEKFLEELAKDPAKTQRYFDSFTDTSTAPGAIAGTFQPGIDGAQGLGRKLQTIAYQASDPSTGRLQALVQRRNDNIRDLNDQVSRWDDRLALRRLGLERQFSSLETALGKMKQQSSWLSGQLASLG